MKETSGRAGFGEAVVGITLVVLGTLALGHNLALLELGPFWRYLPLVLVATGLSKIALNDGKVRAEGIWELLMGCLLLACFFEPYGLGFWQLWPLVNVAWGISWLWAEVTGNRAGQPLKEVENEN